MWEQSIFLATKNIQFIIACGKIYTLPTDYLTIACVLIDNPTNLECCRVMIKDAYYLCDLVQNDVNKKIAHQYFYDKFRERI